MTNYKKKMVSPIAKAKNFRIFAKLCFGFARLNRLVRTTKLFQAEWIRKFENIFARFLPHLKIYGSCLTKNITTYGTIVAAAVNDTPI